MSSESFTVIFNSQGSNVIVNPGGLNTSITYMVNWSAFLPEKYKRFQCQFVFKSQNYAAALLTNVGFVNMNLGKVNIFDGSSQSQNLGMIFPVITNATAGAFASYYSANNSENNDFWITYPANQQITINLNTFAGAAMANMQPYTLMLRMEGIE
jgi:hypothetical protein